MKKLLSVIAAVLCILCEAKKKEFCAKDNHNCENEFSEEGEVDPYLNTLQQDDPELIKALKEFYIDFPTPEINRNVPRYSRVGGQLGQAHYVMELFGKEKTNGFFFEAGAYDGVELSNTLLMEISHNWTGILVEANPDSYSRLLEARRNVWSLGQCLSRKTTPETVLFDAAGVFGGILREGIVKPGDNIPITKREQMMEMIKETRRTIKMQCFPLYSILLATGHTTIDYLSLDIEGPELDVLKTIPWDKVDITVISLEVCLTKLNENLSENHINNYAEIIEYLESVGYKEINKMYHTKEQISFDTFWVKKDAKNVKIPPPSK